MWYTVVKAHLCVISVVRNEAMIAGIRIGLA